MSGTPMGEGLGLEKGVVRLERTPDAWLVVGARLADDVAHLLGCRVEHIGSTSVPGLLSKPIIDLAAGLSADADMSRIERELTSVGWIYRGDAGEDGGHVFVLERQPGIRVAHLHGVPAGEGQWLRYLRFRDRLRSDPAARARYEAKKLELIAAVGGDNARRQYTSGKSEVVRSLDGSAPP